jgi:hypothetical protein
MGGINSDAVDRSVKAAIGCPSGWQSPRINNFLQGRLRDTARALHPHMGYIDGYGVGGTVIDGYGIAVGVKVLAIDGED